MRAGGVRRPAARRCAAAGVVIAAISVAPTIRAQAGGAPAVEPTRVHVRYHAAATCPSEDEFLRRVRSRVQRAQFAEPDAPGPAFDVSITALAGNAGFSGRLEFTDSDEQQVERSLKGRQCDELASSLALITALALDDRSSGATPDAPSPPPSPPPAETRAPTPKINPEPPVPPRLPEPPDRSPRPPPRVRWGFGGNVGVLSWVTAAPSLALGVYAELASSQPAWSVRLSGIDVRNNKQVGSDRADFAADWLRLEACPVTAELGSHFSLLPCAAFDGGRLGATARSSDTLSSSGRQEIFWAAGVALGRLSWVFRDRLLLGVDAELGVPFVRHQYRFDNPVRTVLEVPKIGLGAKFGLGLRF